MPSSCREDSLFARKICQIVKTRPSELTLPSARQGPMAWLHAQILAIRNIPSGH